ncbi:hypothetical protein QJS10_CPB18g00269 [Acorus calamus]|uniref:Uncharacterized protein n=1 Tax=Acorus calamus TaxID=4465 RepID=A0AAV9CN91_ACOCL|nr:hypothetical protein QJS10_CPB18g00269 [Acorus calamus]
MDAIKKARELIKGRRLQGVLLLLQEEPWRGGSGARDEGKSIVGMVNHWRMQSKQLVHRRESHVCRVLVNAKAKYFQCISVLNNFLCSSANLLIANFVIKASPGKKIPNEVIMVDPLEAKRLAAKQMEELQAKERLKRRRQTEAINGAWAMIGLTAGLVIEGQTGNNILNQNQCN